MAKFDVRVTRKTIKYEVADLVVSAKDEEDAQEKAVAMAQKDETKFEWEDIYMDETSFSAEE